MLKSLKIYFEEKHLAVILFAAAFFRLLATIFSKGYGMHDDHFFVIEAAQSWVDGADYNDWLPSASNPDIKASGDFKMNYLIMKNGNALIGHFQGMFKKNILIFNPGWKSML